MVIQPLVSKSQGILLRLGTLSFDSRIYLSFYLLAQVHRDQDGRKLILFAFIILQKRNVMVSTLHTHESRSFTDSKDV